MERTEEIKRQAERITGVACSVEANTINGEIEIHTNCNYLPGGELQALLNLGECIRISDEGGSLAITLKA